MISRHLAILGLTAALSAQQSESLLARVPDGFHNVVYVGDVLPRIKAMLASERLEAAWKEMVPGLAVMDPSLRGVAPRVLLGPLELVELQVPKEIVLSLPDRTMADYGAMLHGGLALAFGYLIVDQGGIDEPALEGFRELAAELFNDVEFPAFQLTMRARNERAAETWFDDALGMIESMAFVEGMQVVVEDQSVRVDMRFGPLLGSPMFGPDGMFGMADASGVLPADLGTTEQIRTWMEGLEVHAELTQRGDVIELRVGDLPEASAQETRAVGPDTVFQVEWESADLLPFAESAYDMVLEFGDEAMDFLDMVAPGQYWTLLDTLSDLSVTAASGATRIDAPEGEIVIDLVERLEGEGFVPPRLQDTGIEDYIPDDLAMSTSSSFWTLDEFVLVQFEEILLALSDLSIELFEQGFEDASDEIDVWSAFLEDDMAEVHEFFEGDDSAYFAEGTVVMVEKMEDGSTPAVAMVGLPYGIDEGEDFVAELADVIRNIDGSGASAETFRAAVEDGVEAIVFEVPGFEVTPESFAEAAFAPHAVFVEDALVLSTSAAFTRRILAAKRGAGDPVGGQRTAQLKTTGEQVGRMLMAVVEPLLDDSRAGRRGRSLFRAVQTGVGLIESIDVVDVDGEESFQQRIRIRY